MSINKTHPALASQFLTEGFLPDPVFPNMFYRDLVTYSCDGLYYRSSEHPKVWFEHVPGENILAFKVVKLAA